MFVLLLWVFLTQSIYVMVWHFFGACFVLQTVASGCFGAVFQTQKVYTRLLNSCTGCRSVQFSGVPVIAPCDALQLSTTALLELKLCATADMQLESGVPTVAMKRTIVLRAQTFRGLYWTHKLS